MDRKKEMQTFVQEITHSFSSKNSKKIKHLSFRCLENRSHARADSIMGAFHSPFDLYEKVRFLYIIESIMRGMVPLKQPSLHILYHLFCFLFSGKSCVQMINNFWSVFISSTVYKRYTDTTMTSKKVILLILICVSCLFTYAYLYWTPVGPIGTNTRVFNIRLNKTILNHSLFINISHAEQNNLIMGSATNLHINSLYRFSRSARSSCHHCTIILLLTHHGVHSDDFKLLAKVFNLQLITYEDLASARTEKAFQTMEIHGRRWIIFNDYLRKQEKLGKTFDNVFFL